MNNLYTPKRRLDAVLSRVYGKNAWFLASLLLLLAGTTQHASAQASCGANVPSFYVDFTGHPDSVWTSPHLTRQGNCCGTTSPDRCLRVEFTIDSNVAAVGFSILVGAVPPGALYYQIDCGPLQDIRTLGCITTPGFHALTFCKPGNNDNVYQVTAVPKPIFPARDTVRVGCSKPLKVLGLTDTSMTWQSVFPGAPGQYNSYLSCTSGCHEPTFTPAVGSPPLIKYKVCGHPIADQCGFVDVCDTVEVQVYPSLLASVSPNPASFCPTAPGVLLTANPSGGLGPYTYIWKNGVGTQVGTGSTYFATSAQTYTVEISDQLVPACPKTIIPVTVSVSNIVLSTAKTNVSCFGGNNGMAVVSGTGGTLPYNYNWVPSGQNNDTAFNLTAQTYTVTVTDVGGCTNSASVSITQPADIVITTDSIVNVKCNGESTGAVYVTVTGGTAPYGYSWEGGLYTTQDITNLPAGTYHLTVTDSKGCTKNTIATVTQPGAIVPLPGGPLFSGIEPTCYGACNGSLSITVTGGTLPYNYAWTPSGNTQTINSLCAGSYCVTVADANGCTVAACTTLTQPDSLMGFIQGVSSYFGGYNVSCYGRTDGSIDLEVTGGTLPYGYSWTPGGAITQDLNNVPADTFTVTITDGRGCIANNTVILTQPDSLQVSLFSPLTPNGTNIGCKGESSGQIFATVTGGTTAYSYSWNYGGATSLDLHNVPAGFYVDTVTDANGCSALDTITLTEPDTLFALITSATVVGGANISCNGDSTGTATVVLTGGTPPFNYMWFPSGDTTVAIDSVGAGQIWVVVHDVNYCSASDTATLTEPPPLVSVTAASTYAGGFNISCHGSSNGTAWVVPSGGTAPYQFLWTPSGSVNDTATNLSAGWQFVRVTDANGCIANDSILLTEPDSLQSPPLPSLFPSGTNLGCRGDSSGSIDLTVTGGTPPYTYAWSNGATTQDVDSLPAGSYSVTITDTNGCMVTANTTLTQPLTNVVIDSLVSPTYPGGWNISCNGGTNGSIFSYPSGGSLPYTYSWSNGDTTLNTFNVSVTTYFDTVRDVNGCMALDSITLTEPPLVVANATSAINISCFGDSSGTIHITTTGGTPPYKYSANAGPFQSDSTFSNLPAGSYFINIADTNGCNDTLTVILTQPPSAFTAGETHVNILCFGDSTGSITITGGGGVTPYTYSLNGGTPDTISSFTNLPAGSYTVLAQDSNGCSVPFNINLTQPAAPLSATIQGLVDINCHGDSTGSITLSLSGGTSPYQLTLDPITMPWQSDSLFASLPAGTYTVYVRDTNGCTTSVPLIALTEPPLLVADSIISTPTSCGVDNGIAQVFVSGGQPAYSYAWSAPSTSTSDTAQGLAAGSYSVVVTDAKGCTVSDSVFVNNLANLSLSIASTTPNSCFGQSLGSITAQPSGGTAPFSYTWSLPATDTTITADSLAAGSYTVMVTDSSGCTASASASLTDPPLLTAGVTGSSSISCFGGNNGTATVTAGGGTGSYSYQWSSSPADTNATVSGLSANVSYVVTVTDALGCLASDSITLTQPAAALSSSIQAQTQVDCFGNATGSVTVTTSGGTTPYQFSLDSATWQSDSSFINLIAGTYTVHIRDTNGCAAQVPVTISQPAASLSSGILVQVNADCFGNASGSVTVSTTGGTTPYQFSLDSATWQSDSAFTNLVAGNYTVHVRDTNGCQTQVPVNISQPAGALSSSILSQINVSCFGGATGSVTVTTTGGTMPYQFSKDSLSWQSDSTFLNLGLGSYTVYVRDTNGCSTQVPVSITAPSSAVSVSVTDSVMVSCFGGNNGTAVAVGTGGTGTISYLWNPGSIANDTATGLIAGTYQVVATDANGCSDSATVVISEPTQSVDASISAFSNVNCFGDSTGMAIVTAAGGTLPYTYLWSTPPPIQTNDTAVNLMAGTYTVLVTDALGCTDTASATISQPSSALQANTLFANPLCYGFNDGSAASSPVGGTPPYTYQWSTGDTTSAISGLDTGTYKVVVTDNLGCVDSATATLVQPAQITTQAGSDSTICEPPSYVLNASAAPGGFIGTWTAVGSSPTFSNVNDEHASVTNLVTGPNILVWTIDNGTCQATDTVIVQRKPDAQCGELELPTGYTPNGDGFNDDYDIHGIENYPLNQFKVFNRWGNEVYSKLNYVNHDWKGKNNNGDDLPDGTYFVILVITNSDIVRTTYVDMRR